MEYNSKKTSRKMASLASKTLANPNASKTQKSLAGSALAQSRTGKQTGAKLEDRASHVVRSRRGFAAETRQLAGSVLSQSNKKR